MRVITDETARETGAQGDGARARRLALVPAALLVAVVVVQLALVPLLGLSPWKGGGFGMFASTDHGSSRRVRVIGMGPQGEWDLVLPRPMRGLVEDVRHAPVVPLIRRLARAAAADAREEGQELSGVRVVVSRTEYAPTNLEPRDCVLRDEAIDVGPGDR